MGAGVGVETWRSGSSIACRRSWCAPSGGVERAQRVVVASSAGAADAVKERIGYTNEQCFGKHKHKLMNTGPGDYEKEED